MKKLSIMMLIGFLLLPTVISTDYKNIYTEDRPRALYDGKIYIQDGDYLLVYNVSSKKLLSNHTFITAPSSTTYHNISKIVYNSNPAQVSNMQHEYCVTWFFGLYKKCHTYKKCKEIGVSE